MEGIRWRAWIALAPFTSEILGDYGDQSVAVIVFAVNITGVSLTFALQIQYSYRRGLLRPEARELDAATPVRRTSSSRRCSPARSRSRCSVPLPPA